MSSNLTTIHATKRAVTIPWFRVGADMDRIDLADTIKAIQRAVEAQKESKK